MTKRLQMVGIWLAYSIIVATIIFLATYAATNNGIFSSVFIPIFSSIAVVFVLAIRLIPLRPKQVKPPQSDLELPLSSWPAELQNTENYQSAITLENQIKNEVKSVVKEVEQAQETIAYQDVLEISKEVSSVIDEILHTASVSPRAALLLLSANIESQMRLLLQRAGLQSATNYALSYQVINNAVRIGLIPKETVTAFRDFVSVRNKVAHGAAFDVSEASILSLVSIGIELLKIISARIPEDTKIHEI